MATYLQGVTDYIPQVQPFAPDFNFYAKSLQFSQGKADAARKQLSNIYGSLLNSPLTREDNSEAREKFFKTIDQDIQRMAGMDLSLQQNVIAAKGVFNQMLDNKGIVKDMVWTKQWQGQQKKSQSFKNCVDPEKCGGAWWEGGDQALQFNKMEFMNASAEDAMGIGVQSYVPYQDVTKRALEMAKEADLNVTIDQVTGQWITTTKNGPQLIGKQLQDLFMGSIGKDPKVQEYYKTKASNQRKGFMYSNEEQYGSLEAAEQAYLQKLTPALETYYGKKTPELKDAVEQNEKIKEKINTAAADAMPDQKTEMERLAAEFTTRGDLLNSSLEESEIIQGEIEVAKRNQKYTGRQADAMIAGMDLHNEIGKAAEVMSYRNYEQTVAVNPYGMEAVQQRNRIMFEGLKQKNRLELEHYKAQLEGEAEVAATRGGADANVPETIKDVMGASFVGDLDPDSEEFKARVLEAYEQDREVTRNGISGSELNIIEQTLDRVIGSAENGDAMAKQDYINIFNAYAGATQENTEDVAYQEEGTIKTYTNKVADQRLSAIKAQVDAATTVDEKYAIAKQYKTNWKKRLRGAQVDYFYEKSILPMIERGKGNDVLRDYLKPVWENNLQARTAIATKKKGLELYDKFNIEAYEQVMGAVNASSEYSKLDKDILKSYIDDKGYVVKEDVFIANMMSRGHSEGKARGLYRGKVEDPTGPNWIRRMYNLATQDYDEYVALRVQAAQAEQKGAHQMWVESFTKHAKPSGDQAWLGMTGAGDGAAMGQRFNRVDPSEYRSLATQSVVSALKDGRDEDVIFSSGDFKNAIPEADVPEVRKIGSQLLIDMSTMTKETNTSRPILTATSINVAGSDNNYMAVNIKMSEKYRKIYGQEKGIYNDAKLTDEGFTMYIPKAKAQNLFYQGTQNTVYEQAMQWQGKIDLDSYPRYFKNAKLESSKETGMYKWSGSAKVTKQDGTADWDYFQIDIPYGKDLNTTLDIINHKMIQLVEKNQIGEEQFKIMRKQIEAQNA